MTDFSGAVREAPGLALFRVLERHQLSSYNGDTERPREERWAIGCDCGFVAHGPEYEIVEAAFGAHVWNDPQFAALAAPQEKQP